VKTTTVSKFQQDMMAEREAEARQSLADQLVAEGLTDEKPAEADPFVGMHLEIEPDEAYGMIQAKVRGWLDDRGIIAQEDEIRAMTNDLYGAAQGTAHDPVADAIARNGKVDFVDMDSDEGRAIVRSGLGQSSELPGMPEKPAPKMVMRVPSDAEFGQDGEEFFISSPLRARALELIDRHPDLFEHLSGMSLTYLWKKAGGKSKGAPILGKTQKPSGLLKLFSESTFVIWLAADHCRARYYGDPEIEQLLFHEMLHTAVGEPDEETGRGGGPVLVPHQLEIFDAEIEVYGLEGIALKEAAPLFRQAVYDAPKQRTSVSSPSIERQKTEELPPDGQLIHDDGTPLTADEIAEQEAAELRDDPADDDDSLSDVEPII